MEYKEIKKLMDEMGNSKLTEMEIEFQDGIKIKMKKDSGNMQNIPIIQSQVMPVSSISKVPVQEVNVNNTNVVENKESEVKGITVKSPMVGTFYSKSSPSSEPFVKIGSKVKKGDTLCIIEAMKLMNEIESEYDEMVDYGKPLFIIK